MTSWRELEQSDVGLAKYIANRVEAELARRQIDVHTAKLEVERQRLEIKALQQRVKELKP